jgi:hypothetical protein
VTAVPIALRSNPGKYTFSGNTRLLNAYCEQQGNDAKAPMVVLPVPGMVSCCEVADTPGRGTIFLDDLDCAYVVHSSSVYKVTLASAAPFTLSATRIGALPGNDQVQISRNQAEPVQISIHCAAGEFYIENDVVKTVSDDDVTDETIISQDNAGGYTVRGATSGKFLISGLNDTADVDGLDFATAEQSADRLIRVKSDRGDLFLFGSETTEPWRNTGQADFPFEPIGGSVLQKGLKAANAVVALDNTLAFPGHDDTIYRLNGYAPQRISTHYIERRLQADTDPTAIRSLGYSTEGHQFAYWTGDTYTVGYDAATQAWHDRQSWQMDKWRARNAFRAWGKTIVQDSLSGELFYLDGDTHSEDGNPLIWGVDTPFLHAFPNGGIVDALHIDMDTGVGALLSTSQGYDPKLMLSWSVDGGATWKGNRELSLGARGHRIRITTRRLGRFGPKGIQFRLRVSDPIIRAIVAMDAEVRPLKK